jgi:hypothetical protein
LAFLTQAMLAGRFALRACILHYATTEADPAALVEVVRETAARLSPARTCWIASSPTWRVIR